MRTGSTNADLLSHALAGGPEGEVLVAELQTAGRGRLGRAWVSPAGAGLTFSVLLRPRGVPQSAWGWLPLLAGVAAARAVREVAGVSATLKWPNDVLAGERKLAGILAENREQAVVLGLGLNVWHRHDELPLPAATSLALEGTPEHRARERLLACLLGELGRCYLGWRDQPHPGDADRCGLRGAYLALCSTVGREVTVTLPGERIVTGVARGIAAAGHLDLCTPDGPVVVSAGDVVHVR
jgi:BirA family biotin operon repressor/biotin-[acetyl-CoA-carboxylase] ligase